MSTEDSKVFQSDLLNLQIYQTENRDYQLEISRQNLYNYYNSIKII